MGYLGLSKNTTVGLWKVPSLARFTVCHDNGLTQFNCLVTFERSMTLKAFIRNKYDQL